MNKIYLIEPNKEKNGHFHLYLSALNRIDGTQPLQKEVKFLYGNPFKKIYGIYRALKSQLNEVPKDRNNISHILYSDIYYKVPFITSGLLRRSKTIVTMHSCPNGWLKHLLIKNFCKRVDAVIVHSEYIKSKIESMGLSNVYLVHYPSFYDYSKIGTKNDVRSKYNIPANKIVISALGGTREDKGADLLLECFAHISPAVKKDIIINIAGKAIDFDEDILKRIAERNGVNVRLDLRMLSDEEFMENVVMSDYMVFPYRKHMTANSGPMTEAMVNKIPCIVPAETNLSDIAKKYNVGINFEQENIISLAHAIESLVLSPKTFKYDIADELKVDTFIKKHKEIYKLIINKL